MNDNLPPLPEPEFMDIQIEKADAQGTCPVVSYYTEEKMREYGQLCRQQALEEAAIRGGAACDALMDAARVAEAIRSLK